MMRNSLSNRWQKAKINTTFSSWSAIIKGTLQGSVLGPILFIFSLMTYSWSEKILMFVNLQMILHLMPVILALMSF